MKKINLTLFAKVFDLSDLVTDDKASIKVMDKTYFINDSFATVLKIDEMAQSDVAESAMVKKFFEITLGEESTAELLSQNFSVAFYKRVVQCIKEAITLDEEPGTQQ